MSIDKAGSSVTSPWIDNRDAERNRPGADGLYPSFGDYYRAGLEQRAAAQDSFRASRSHDIPGRTSAIFAIRGYVIKSVKVAQFAARLRKT